MHPDQPKLRLQPLFTRTQEPAVLFKNTQTLVQAAMVGELLDQNVVRNHAAVVKSTRGLTVSQHIEDYLVAINCIEIEAKFYRELAWICPHIVRVFSEEHFEDYNPRNPQLEEARLVVERITPLKEILGFIKATGLPNMLSVAQGMYRCVSFVHRHGLAHNDVKPGNFGIDFDVEEPTYPDGMFKPDIVKGIDFGTLKELKPRQSADFPGTPAYLPEYRFRIEITDLVMIKSDIMALTLTYYDMLTNHKRFPSPERLPQESLEQWMYRTMKANHTPRYCVEDFWEYFSINPDATDQVEPELLKKIELLVIKLNRVMENALSPHEHQGYQQIEDFYLDFICSFEDVLSEEQLSRVFN